MGKIILGILGVLSIGLFGYVSLCLLSGRTPVGGAVFGMIAFISPFIVGGVWYGLRSDREVIANHARCRACDYDLTGHEAMIGRPDARCPECGELLHEANIVKAGELVSKDRRRSMSVDSAFVAITLGVIFWIKAIDKANRGQWDAWFWAMGLLALLMTALLGCRCWMLLCRKRRSRSEERPPLT